ncbi:sensor histidine kinase [Frigoribacterium sp. PvP032]|uniref:sensor histidine kinase n=1 Tax=Frigoribacterium sp. PvP032 TaxID=2806589 RepID=UPI001AE31973|nr:histidine kinase [Frigoribacterium sp. PvP032]MBP1191204.1 signal transduction histidine kinase [Frigoribacterium sp. PvP032]
MTSFRLVAHVVAPAGGASFIALWTIAEAGRSGLAGVVTVAAVLGLAIGLSVFAPLVALAVVAVLPAMQLVGIAPATSETTWPMYFAVCLVALVVAATGARRERLLALPAALLATTLAVANMTVPTDAEPYRWTSWTSSFSGSHPIRDSLTVLLLAGVGLVVLAWGTGYGIGAAGRLRRLDSVLSETEDRLAETDLELRLGAERSRISRDVHDSVAHALTIVVAQSEGATALHRREPEVVDVVLAAVSGVAREALADVRGLVERITEPGDELVSLSDVPALVERMRGVGMTVVVEELGERPGLRPAQQLTVYRLVQESLTNALKHGGQASRASVVLDWRGGGLALLVHSSGGTPLIARGSLAGPGAGITGMAERAAISGGWLTAEPGDAGDFVVTAYLPFGGSGGGSVGTGVGERALPRAASGAGEDRTRA